MIFSETTGVVSDILVDMQTEASIIEVSEHNSETISQRSQDGSSRMDPKLKLSIILLFITILCLILIQIIKYRKQWAKFCKEQSFIVDAEKRAQEIFIPPPKYEIAINMPKPNDPSQSDSRDLKDNEKSTCKLSNSECFRINSPVRFNRRRLSYVQNKSRLFITCTSLANLRWIYGILQAT